MRLLRKLSWALGFVLFALCEVGMGSVMEPTPPDGYGQCGVHALYVLQRLEGYHIKLSEIRSILPPSVEGYSLLDLKTCATTLKIPTVVKRYSPSRPDAVKPPCIIHVDLQDGGLGHYFAILKVTDLESTYCDGTTGKVWTVQNSWLAGRATGYALVVVDPPNRIKLSIVLFVIAIGFYATFSMAKKWR